MGETSLIVPWFDTKEWQEVHQNLFGLPANPAARLHALDSLLVWKARCPILPSSIESTLCLLEASLEEGRKDYITKSDTVIRLAMSSALIRFVNHILDNETAKGLSFFQAAKKLDIPEWVIDLRHDISHNCILPHMETLIEAMKLALNWLEINYWNKHNNTINNFVVGKLVDGEDIESKIGALLNFCISLGICSHSKCNINYLSEITDNNVREALINEAKDLFESIDYNNSQLLTVNLLIETMYSKSKTLMMNDVASKHVNKILLSEESLFLSLELHNSLDNFNLDCSKSLSKQYVECFEVLLNYVHTNELLQDFVLELIKYTLSDENSDRKRKLVAQWLSTIFKALKMNQLFIEKIYETETQDWSLKDRKEIYSLFYHWFPNKKKSILLDLRKPVPKDLTNISFIQPIISTYNPYLTYFINNLLQLVQPPLQKPIIEKICQLARIVATPETLHIIMPSKIYTVKDLESNTDISDDEVVEINEEHMDVVAEDCLNRFGIWERDSSDYDWSKCPIGMLPWQLDTADEQLVEKNSIGLSQ